MASINSKEPIQLFGRVLETTISTWTPSASLDNPTIANPVANPTGDVIYKVVSSLYDNGNLCKDSSLFYVNVTPSFYSKQFPSMC